jgi:hypothetical protein
MPPPPGEEEDDEAPAIRTPFLLFTLVLGAGVLPFLRLPIGLIALALALGAVAGIIWCLGGRMGAVLAFLILSSLAAGSLRPILDRIHDPVTAGLLSMLPGMTAFAAVLLGVRFVKAQQDKELPPSLPG